LLKANHILGSAQVLVNTNDNKSILYSSDFSYGTEPVKCDVLILDATHGDPRFNAVIDGVSLENTLCRLVDEYIEAGTPITIRAHVGRLQYTMSVLSKEIDRDIIFLASKKNSRLAKVYEKWGMPIRDLMDNSSYDAEAILEGNYPFIEFKTENAAPSNIEMSGKSAVFHLGGHHLGNKTVIQQLYDSQTKKLTKNYRLEFGDHGNYDGILKYIEKCEPKLVVTDNYRSAWGEKLADKITTELKIKAISQPANRNPRA
jgi:Cft2 family RNA processing exonuclease